MDIRISLSLDMIYPWPVTEKTNYQYVDFEKSGIQEIWIIMK